VIRPSGAVAGALGSAVAGAAGLGFGIGYGVWENGSPLAGFFPGLAGAGLLVFSLLAAIREWPRPVEPEASFAPNRQGHWRLLLGYLAGLLAFAFLMEPVGAIPMIALLFLWLMRAVERLAWRIVLPVTVAATLGAWLLFDRLLQVPLPRGLLA
jgi:putative tricarboxylic transport membrane protein